MQIAMTSSFAQASIHRSHGITVNIYSSPSVSFDIKSQKLIFIQTLKKNTVELKYQFAFLCKVIIKCFTKHTLYFH